MTGLVIAVTRGVLDEDHIDLVLSDATVEVPFSPSANLVLAECVFRDGIFAPPWGARARASTSTRSGCLGLPQTAASDSMRAAVIHELCSEASRSAFSAFVRQLEEEGHCLGKSA